MNGAGSKEWNNFIRLLSSSSITCFLAGSSQKFSILCCSCRPLRLTKNLSDLLVKLWRVSNIPTVVCVIHFDQVLDQYTTGQKEHVEVAQGPRTVELDVFEIEVAVTGGFDNVMLPEAA